MADSTSPPLSAALSLGGTLDGEDRKVLLEQYKLYVETSNKVSERRAGTQTFLLTANTFLVTIYSLAAGKDVALRSADQLWKLAIPLAGLAVTLAWFMLIRSYRIINGAKFQVINRMEDHLPIQPFHLEWTVLQGDAVSGRIGLTRVEQAIPLVFACLYVALGTSTLV